MRGKKKNVSGCVHDRKKNMKPSENPSLHSLMYVIPPEESSHSIYVSCLQTCSLHRVCIRR